MYKEIFIIGHIIRFRGGKVDILEREETFVEGKLIRTIREYLDDDWNGVDLATALKKVTQINLKQLLKYEFYDVDELIDFMNEVKSDCNRVEWEWEIYMGSRVCQSTSEDGGAP